MGDINQLSAKRLDILGEIINIGSGNAATAMSQLLNKKVEMSLPHVEVCPLTEIGEIYGNSENIVVAVYFRLFGEIPGGILFVLPVESTDYLVRLLIAGYDSLSEYVEDELVKSSAIMEIGNILTGAYLNAIHMMTDKSLHPSTPSYAVDMFGAILSSLLFDIGNDSDYALLLDTSFTVGEEDIKSNLFLIPDAGALDSLFQAIEVKYCARID